MNKGDLDLLDLCMEDDLFCALYNALCYFGKEWHTAPAVELWAEALQARQRLHVARRPDLLIGQIFADVSAQEALLVEALLMWMLFTEDGGHGRFSAQGIARQAAHGPWRGMAQRL